MNKKLIAALAAITIAVPATANAAGISNKAESTPTLAIIDTAFDTSVSTLKGKVVYEVCIIEWATCPNGQSFMEGLGSTNLPKSTYYLGGFEHGTQMASGAVMTNPNINLVLIRIIGRNINNDRQITNEKTIATALQWVYDNKDKFNIQAVSMSQGHHNLLPLNEYCPVTPDTESKIRSLKALNVPTFFPTGNQRDYRFIDWPACISDSIAIGAGTKFGIEIYANADPLRTDFYANGALKVVGPDERTFNVAGTSMATQIAAAQWIAVKQAKPQLSYTDIYNLFVKTAIPIKGKSTSGILIDLKKALL